MRRSLAAAVILIPIHLAADIRFDAPRSARCNATPIWIAVADFNGDGFPDMVAGSIGLTTLLPGREDGTFAGPGLDVRGASTSVPPLVADFDGDGKLDIVTAANGALTFSRSRGDGTFDTAVRTSLIPSPAFPRDAVVADFDADGRPDVVLTLDERDTILIAHNAGNAQFTQTTLSAGFNAGGALRAADVNGDGKPDLIVAAQSAAMAAVLLNNGSGFAAPVSLSTSAIVGDIAAADFNGDGRLDLFMATRSTTANLFFGRGDGTFQSPANVTLPAAGFPSQSCVAGDFNHDGRQDVALRVNLYGQSWAVILLGNGDGTFRAGEHDVARGPIVAADLDRDGNLDLALGDYAAPEAATLMGRGDGTFAGPSTVFPPLSPQATAHVFTTGDFDGDGALDIAEVTAAGMTILQGHKDGTFATGTTNNAGAFAPGIPAAADFDGDGRLDLAIVNDGALVVAFNRGDFLFDLATFPSITASAASGPVVMTAGDLDGDGLADLVVANQSRAAVLHNRGGRNFDAPAKISTLNGDIWSVTLRDLDRDGRPDIVLGMLGILVVHKQLAGGVFGPPLESQLFFGGAAVLADFDLDGKPDAIVAGGGRIAFLPGRGDGTFGAVQYVDFLDKATVSLVATDVDSDGLLDIVVTALPYGQMLVYRGNGDGTFEPPVRFFVGVAPLILSGDFNGDGKPDIVARTDAVTALLLNRSTLSPTTNAIWTGAGPDTRWSTAGNWLSSIAPAQGQTLIFPPTVNMQSVINDFEAGTRFGTITLSGSYRITGNEISSPLFHVLSGSPDVGTSVRLGEGDDFFIGENAKPTLRSGILIAGHATINASAASELSVHGAPRGSGTLTVTGAGRFSIVGGVIGSFNGTIVHDGQGVLTIDAAMSDAKVEAHNSGSVSFFIARVSDTAISSGLRVQGPAFTRNLALTGGDLIVDIFYPITVTGTVTLGTKLHLNLVRPVTAGTTITLIDNDGTDAVSGTFAGLPEGAVYRTNGMVIQDFRVSYAGGTGNDVVLTALEPWGTSRLRPAR